MAIEQTLVLIKPDGAKRRLTGLVIDRLDAAGLQLAGSKMVSVTEDLARAHYQEHVGKAFFENLVRYIRGEFHAIPDSRILALVYEGENAVAAVRKVAGATNPENADPSTVRGSLGRVTTQGQFENVLHASGSVSEAEREIKLWFLPHEIIGPRYPAKKSGADPKVLVWA
ncbi:MAG: nucleoside-diphosphate kinase [Elusimicrobiota bacterium]|jgi:nucleoside-diphosphate kinase